MAPLPAGAWADYPTRCWSSSRRSPEEMRPIAPSALPAKRDHMKPAKSVRPTLANVQDRDNIIEITVHSLVGTMHQSVADFNAP